jgi:hypothetical protein
MPSFLNGSIILRPLPSTVFVLFLFLASPKNLYEPLGDNRLYCGGGCSTTSAPTLGCRAGRDGFG